MQSAGKSGEFYTPRAITQFIPDMVNPRLGEKILDPACGTGGYLTCAIEHLKTQAKNVADRKSIESNIAGCEYKPLPYLLATTNLVLHDIKIPNIKFGDALDQPLSNFTEKNRVNVILANPPFGGIVANGNETNFPQTYRTKESADLFLILMIHLLKQDGRAGIVLPDGSLTGDGVKVGKEDLIEQYLFLTTSHDGCGSITAAFTPVRIVCNNTLNAALQNHSNAVKIRHTANAKGRLEEAHKLMGITSRLNTQLEGIFNQWAKVRILDPRIKKAYSNGAGTQQRSITKYTGWQR